jgi:hypothetical protein
VSRGLLLWPSFRQIDLHQMTVRRATFKLLRAVLRAPAIVSPAAILIAGLVTGHTEIDPATGRRSVSGLPTIRSQRCGTVQGILNRRLAPSTERRRPYGVSFRLPTAAEEGPPFPFFGAELWQGWHLDAEFVMKGAREL